MKRSIVDIVHLSVSVPNPQAKRTADTMKLFPPTYAFPELCERLAEENDQKPSEIARVLAAAILDQRLSADPHFPPDLPVPAAADWTPPIPGIPYSAYFHLRDVAAARCAYDLRLDLRYITIHRDALRELLQREGHPLPEFWFGAPTFATSDRDQGGSSVRQRKKQEKQAMYAAWKAHADEHRHESPNTTNMDIARRIAKDKSLSGGASAETIRKHI